MNQQGVLLLLIIIVLIALIVGFVFGQISNRVNPTFNQDIDTMNDMHDVMMNRNNSNSMYDTMRNMMRRLRE